MNSSHVHIDFEVMASALKEHVRRKAIKAGSTIIYIENGQLIEENPQTQTKVVLKKIVAKS